MSVTLGVQRDLCQRSTARMSPTLLVLVFWYLALAALATDLEHRSDNDRPRQEQFMYFARHRWRLLGVAGVVMACGGATQPVCIRNTQDLEIDPAITNTVHTPDGRGTLVLPAGVLATGCMAALRVGVIEDYYLPHAAAQGQGAVIVPNSGVEISLQYDDGLRAPATLILRYGAGSLPGNARPSDLRIASVVHGSCGAIAIGGPCTRDPTDKLTARGGVVMESAREVRLAMSDSLSRTYALIVPQPTTPRD